MVCAMVLYAGLSACKNILRPDLGFDDPRGAVAAIMKDWQAGDCIYASGAATPVIVYYGRVLGGRKRLDFEALASPLIPVRGGTNCPAAQAGRALSGFSILNRTKAVSTAACSGTSSSMDR